MAAVSEIHLDVLTELDNARVRKVAREIHQTLERAGRDGGSAMERHISDAARRAAAAQIDAQRRVDAARAQSAHQADAQIRADSRGNDVLRQRIGIYDELDKAAERHHRRELARIDAQARAYGRGGSRRRRGDQGFDFGGMASGAGHLAIQGAISGVSGIAEVGRAATSSASGVASLSGGLASLGSSGRGAGMLLIAGVIPPLYTLASAAATASQSIMALPAAGAAATAAFVSLKLGTEGFGQALKDIRDPAKFAEDLRALSPAAQQAALSIQSLLPQFDALKMKAQEALFDGMGQQIERLSGAYLPTIEHMVTGINGAFNDMATGIADELMTPDSFAAIQNLTSNISTAFHEIAPAAAEVAKAFLDMASSGSNVLPDLAASAADVARSFGDWIEKLSKSGEFEARLREGLTALKELGKVAVEVGGSMFELLEVSGPAAIMAIKTGGHVLATVFKGIAIVVEQTIRLINTAIAAYNKLPTSDISPIPLGVGAADSFGYSQGGIGNSTAMTGIAPAPSPYSPHQSPAAGIGGSLGTRLSQAGTGWGPAHSSGTGGTGGSGGRKNPAYVDPSQFTVPAMTGPTGGFTPGLGTPGYGPGGQTGTFTVDPQGVFSAESAVQSARHGLEEARLRLINLEAEGNASQLEVLRAKNEVAERERALTDAQMKLDKERQGTFKKAEDNLKDHANAMDDIGAQLDNDLGISKGLPGIADNIVRFLASLAFAPAMGALSAVKQHGMAEAGLSQSGSGLFGMFMRPGQNGTGTTAAGYPGQPNPTGYPGYSNSSGIPAMSMASVGMPSILNDTGRVPSGPQSRLAATLIQQRWGGQLRGKIGGSRDNNTAKNTHDAGLSIDIPIGPDQMALGDEINAWLQANAAQLGLKYSIWRDQGRYPGGGGFTTPGHQNHIDAHFNGQPGSVAGPFTDPMGATTAMAGFGSSGATPVFVVNMPGGGFGIPGLGTPASGNGMGPLPGPGQGGLSPEQWNKIAGAEASGNWKINTGNGFFGGLQIKQSTWDQFGGGKYAARADLATPEQQMDIGNKILAGQGPGAWPATSAAHPEWFQPSGSVNAPTLGLGNPAGAMTPGLGVPGGGGMLPGMGYPQAASFGNTQQPIGYDGKGGFQPAGGGFGGLGGAPMGAIQGAISAAGSAAAPFGGQAAAAGAQMLMQIMNRTAGFAGQATAIGLQGLGQTLLPAGSQLGDMSNNWLGKIAAGFAGARPAQAMSAGKQEIPDQNLTQKSSADPSTQQHGQGGSPGPGNGPLFRDLVVQDPKDGQKIAREVQWLNAYGAGQGH